MPNVNSLLLAVLTSLALALGAFATGPMRGAAAGQSASEDTAGAQVFVFGSLARPGDASSFRAHRGWRRLVEGRGRSAQVSLVVVPEGAARASLPSHAAILAAQSEGRVFVIETQRTVPTRSAQAFRAECAANANASYC